MIRVQRSYIDAVQAASAPEHLYKSLNRAIQLEHSTIPPYLTAMFSLNSDTNRRIGSLIHSVVIEEMLHLSIAANILIAIGGSPAINAKDFIPAYPGPLPMSIGGAGFDVGIEAFSIDLVEKTFMTIEAPEHPIPVRERALLAGSVEEEETFGTISEFYRHVKQKLAEFGDGIFTVGPERQMLSWFPETELSPITDVKTASAGIDLIVEQGEGTTTNPFDAPDEPAHYYRFGEIVHGREIVRTDDGYAWAGAPVPFDPSGVFPVKSNCKIADFSEGSQQRERITQFSLSYSNLLNVLHETFNGRPERINAAMGAMFELKVISRELMSTPIGDGSEFTVGPSFEYITRS